jgi:hypothetical protein
MATVFCQGGGVKGGRGQFVLDLRWSLDAAV